MVVDRYVPGKLSHAYQRMSSAEQSLIDRQVDELFRKKTGVSAMLDWNHVRDRPHARVWLRIRDAVVAKYLFAKTPKLRVDISPAHEAEIRAKAQEYEK